MLINELNELIISKVDKITKMSGDGEAFHIAEDELMKEFIKIISLEEQSAFVTAAKEIVKLNEINADRWYS